MAVLKLKPACKDYLWGGSRLKTEFKKEFAGDILAETWELSCHPDGESTIAEGNFAGKTLGEYIKANGAAVLGKSCEKFEDFPLLIKFIDAKGDLSIQVHPDDDYAAKYEGQHGKTEMWYVADCDEGASIFYGFSKEISKDEFRRRIENGTLLEVLNRVPTKKGDVFFIEAGTIHAIGGGNLIAEIQQNCNLTYRVYDYGRLDKDGKPRELHIEKALGAARRTTPPEHKPPRPHIAKCDYFTVDKVSVDGTCGLTADDSSFVSVLVLEGEGSLTCGGDSVSFKKGDSLFITAGSGEFTINGRCCALITRV